MYVSIFIGNILDSYIYNLGNIHLLFKSCQIHLFVLLLILLIAAYYDLKFGIIPNKISLVLLIYALIFNLILSISFNNTFIFLFSIVSTVLITVISFVLWFIGFWGGGDLKIFIGLSLALSFLDLDNIHFDYFSNLSFPFSNQFLFYPKVISILFNAILIALAFILMLFIYEIIKNKKIKHFSILSILNIKMAFNQITSKTVNIDNLNEGMVLNEYYFKSKEAYDRINDEKNKNSSNHNLKAQKEGDLYCFSSLKRIGLANEDIELIMDLYEKDLIKNPEFKIMIGIPFMPFITLGYICFLVFGDFITIISAFLKALF